MGEFFTMPRAFDGAKIEINARTGCGGTVQAELWERQPSGAGAPVPGCSFTENVPFRGNEIWTPCQWRGGNLAALRGRDLILRFRLTNAKIFGVRFTGHD